MLPRERALQGTAFMINIRALFSDETQTFKTPYEPKSGDTVTLKIRTLKNDVLRAYAVINGVKRNMEKYLTDDSFDWFKVEFKCPSKAVRYYFRLVDEDDTVCYNRLGGVENSQPEYDFSFVPDRKVPDWAKGAVYYRFFPTAFATETPTTTLRTTNIITRAGIRAGCGSGISCPTSWT